MSTAIIVAVLIVIAVIAIRSYAKKLTSGCCGGETEHVKKIKVEDKDVSHYPYCVQIGIAVCIWTMDKCGLERPPTGHTACNWTRTS